MDDSIAYSNGGGRKRGLRPTTSPRRPMARGALVRLQARDGYRTSDKLPSLACHASASIIGCVRKSLSRLRPSACLTRDHRLGAACCGSEAGEPTGAREHVCGPGVILTVGVKGAREMHLRRSRQVPRRAQRGALRSKVARGCARASKSCRWGARKLRVGRAGRAQASPSGGAEERGEERILYRDFLFREPFYLMREDDPFVPDVATEVIGL